MAFKRSAVRTPLSSTIPPFEQLTTRRAQTALSTRALPCRPRRRPAGQRPRDPADSQPERTSGRCSGPGIRHRERVPPLSAGSAMSEANAMRGVGLTRLRGIGPEPGDNAPYWTGGYPGDRGSTWVRASAILSSAAATLTPTAPPSRWPWTSRLGPEPPQDARLAYRAWADHRMPEGREIQPLQSADLERLRGGTGAGSATASAIPSWSVAERRLANPGAVPQGWPRRRRLALTFRR